MTTAVKQRVLLPGVPRIGYDVRLCPFPGALSACLEYLGAPVDYDYIMGVTGAAFRRFWNRDDGGNIDLFYLGVDPAQRILEALGYEWRVLAPERQAMIDAVKESIDRGVPVIAFGIIGPPETGLVTGYADDGETLYGWSYFQEGRDAYYEKPGWFETMEQGSHANQGALVIGARTAPLPERKVCAGALRRAIELASTPAWPEVPDHSAGIAACRAWADALEVDEDYPRDNAGVLGLRMMVHGDQCVMLEERLNAAAFLRQAAGVLPEAAAPLEAAASLYAQVQAQDARAWPWDDYTMGPANQQRLADPATRRAIAAAIREAADLEAQAVEQLQQALTRVG
jgi:hypothetical protein